MSPWMMSRWVRFSSGEADAGLGLQPFQVGAHLARLAAQFLLLLFVAAGIELLLQVLSLAVERAHLSTVLLTRSISRSRS